MSEVRKFNIGHRQFSFVGIEGAACERWAKMCAAGRWEPPIVDFLSRELKAGDVFFDIGAFLGPYSLLAAELVGERGRVVAFEPDARINRQLRANIELNACGNVDVHEIAIGAKNGGAPFKTTGDSMSLLSPHGTTIVSVLRLDDFCRKVGLWPTVVKIDIEGGETCFLGAESAAIRNARAVIMEVHPAAIEAQGFPLDAFLQSLGGFSEIHRKSGNNFHISLQRPI